MCQEKKRGEYATQLRRGRADRGVIRYTLNAGESGLFELPGLRGQSKLTKRAEKKEKKVRRSIDADEGRAELLS